MIQPGFLGLLHLVGGKAVFQRASQLLVEVSLRLGHILRRGNGRCGEPAAVFFGGDVEARVSAVAQPVLDANAQEEARVGRPAKDHAGNGESRVVGILIIHLQGHPGQEKGVLLVGRFNLVVDRSNFFVCVADALVAAGALPIAEKFADEFLHLFGIELAADDDLTFPGAVKLTVKPAQIQRGQGVRFRLAALGAGDALLADLLEFGLRERGLAQQFPGEAQRVGQVRLQRPDVRRSGVDIAGHADLCLQAVSLILYLLTVFVLRSAHQQRSSHGRRGGFAEQRLLVAEPDVHHSHHRASAGLLWEHHQLQPVGHRGADHAGFHVLRRGIEDLALLNGRAAFVILEACSRIRRGWYLGAIGSSGRNKLAQRAVGGFQVSLGHARHVGRSDFAYLVAMEEESPPVAVARISAQHDGDGLGIRQGEFNVLQDAGLGAVNLLLGGRIACEVFHRLQQDLLGLVDGLIRLELSECQRYRWIVIILGVHAGGYGLFRVHQLLVQPSRLRSAQYLRHHFQRRHIRMQGGRNMIGRHDHLDIAHPAQQNGALSFLRRLHRVGLGEHALRPGQGADGLRHHGQRFRFIELSGDDQVGVVGLVVFLVENSQVRDGHSFHVSAIADD